MVRRITKIGIVAIGLGLIAARFGRSGSPEQVGANDEPSTPTATVEQERSEGTDDSDVVADEDASDTEEEE